MYTRALLTTQKSIKVSTFSFPTNIVSNKFKKVCYKIIFINSKLYGGRDVDRVVLEPSNGAITPPPPAAGCGGWCVGLGFEVFRLGVLVWVSMRPEETAFE